MKHIAILLAWGLSAMSAMATVDYAPVMMETGGKTLAYGTTTGPITIMDAATLANATNAAYLTTNDTRFLNLTNGTTWFRTPTNDNMPVTRGWFNTNSTGGGEPPSYGSVSNAATYASNSIPRLLLTNDTRAAQINSLTVTNGFTSSGTLFDARGLSTNAAMMGRNSSQYLQAHCDAYYNRFEAIGAKDWLITQLTSGQALQMGVANANNAIVIDSNGNTTVNGIFNAGAGTVFSNGWDNLRLLSTSEAQVYSGATLNMVSGSAGKRFDLVVGAGSNTRVGPYNFGIWDSGNAACRFVINQTGNVGLGTTNAATLLDVNGDATVRGSIYVTNSAQGIYLWFKNATNYVFETANATQRIVYCNVQGAVTTNIQKLVP